MLHGNCRTSKVTLIKYLESFLKEYSSNCADKFVMLNQGDKLSCNPEIRSLFQKYTYKVSCTGADASNQNGPIKRAHCTISDSICVLLFGSSLSAWF